MRIGDCGIADRQDRQTLTFDPGPALSDAAVSPHSGPDRTFKVCLSCRSAISHRRYALWTILAQSPMAVRPAPIRHPPQPPNLHQPQQSATSFCIVSPAARHPGTPGAAPGLDRTFKVCLSCRSAISIADTHCGLSLRNHQWPSDPHPFATRPNPQTSINPSNQQYPSALSVRPRGTQELRALHRALIEPSRFACLADQRSAIADTHSGLSLRNHQWPSDPHPFATAPAPKPPSPPAIRNILLHCQSGREAAQELRALHRA